MAGLEIRPFSFSPRARARVLATALSGTLAVSATVAAAPNPAAAPRPPARAAKAVALQDPKELAKAEEAVRTVVAAWLDAQNKGQFAAYEPLYAAKFQGVKRSGPRVRRFNRAGWMADRKHMFAKPMQVTMDAPKVHVSGAVAIVDGTQNWSSASYKDTGTKRLLLYREDKGWRIAREEMLQSKIDGKPLQGGEAYLPLYENNLVFAAGGDDPSWLTGPPKHDVQAPGEVIRAVNVAKLPTAISQWQGKTVRVYDRSGEACLSKVTGFRVRATAQWHFGSVQSWSEGEVPEADVIKEVWSQGTHLLEGTLEPVKGAKCEGVVAFDAAKRAPTVVPFETMRDAALSSAVKEAQAALGKGKGTVGSPTGYVATLAKPDATGARRYTVLVSNSEICSSEEGTDGTDGTFVWRAADDTQKGKLLRKNATGAITPLLLVDLDDDGELELVYQGWPTVMVGFEDLKTGDSLPGAVDVPYYDCPC